MHRRCLLPVHGHVVPRLRATEARQVQDEPRARVHPELQGSAGSIQENGSGEGKESRLLAKEICRLCYIEFLTARSR